MDKKSKFLIIIFFIGILISAGVTYYKDIVRKDFPVVGSTPEE